MTEGRDLDRIVGSVIRLHSQKDASYGNAWKKRGEVIGVMANIARKVDRLENVAAGAPGTPDETSLDTAVDLFVYSVKYCAYLADQDDYADNYFFGNQYGGSGSRSDGTRFVDVLLRKYAQPLVNKLDIPSISRAVVETFDELMRCFSSGGFASIQTRVHLADVLAKQSWTLVLAQSVSAPIASATFNTIKKSGRL